MLLSSPLISLNDSRTGISLCRVIVKIWAKHISDRSPFKPSILPKTDSIAPIYPPSDATMELTPTHAYFFSTSPSQEVLLKLWSIILYLQYWTSSLSPSTKEYHFLSWTSIATYPVKPDSSLQTIWIPNLLVTLAFWSCPMLPNGTSSHPQNHRKKIYFLISWISYFLILLFWCL